MNWRLSNRADKRALPLADRHYNRQKIGSPQFVPPGRCLVLLTPNADALWVTSWPFAQYVRHAWPGAWIGSCFRNESSLRASELIVEGLAITRWYFGEPPSLGFVTFIDLNEIKPTMVRGEPMAGWTYRKAGFELVGVTASGLLAFQILKAKMPPAQKPPMIEQLSLFAEQTA